MGSKDTVLPNPILKNYSVNCLPFEENTRKHGAVIMYISLELWSCICIEMTLEEETSKLFNLFVEKTSGTDPANSRGVFMEDIAVVEDIVQVDFFLYDIDVVDGSVIGEVARQCVVKYFNAMQL